ncbi:MAG: Uncharacterized protein XD85_0425 [Parcubacteria bacterium 34_609]|nr:MAG: Uncharacterized protein XD85_0425 [Parcubacteria bacterium 34_609]
MKRLLKKYQVKTELINFSFLLDRMGNILLRPLITIPSREAWIYEKPELIGKIRKGLQEAKEGKTEKVESLDEFSE